MRVTIGTCCNACSKLCLLERTENTATLLHWLCCSTAVFRVWTTGQLLRVRSYQAVFDTKLKGAYGTLGKTHSSYSSSSASPSTIRPMPGSMARPLLLHPTSAGSRCIADAARGLCVECRTTGTAMSPADQQPQRFHAVRRFSAWSRTLLYGRSTRKRLERVTTGVTAVTAVVARSAGVL